MEHLTLALGLTTGLFFGAAIYWFLRFSWEHHAYGVLQKSWEDERDERLILEQEAREARKQSIREREDAAKAREEARVLRDGLALNTKLLTSQAMANEDLAKEKSDSWALQQTQALMLGNGQSIILTQYQRLLKEYNAYRETRGDKPTEPSPAIQKIMQEVEA